MSDVPIVPKNRVALVYNLKNEDEQGETEDAQAEYDSIETVIAIKNSLEKYGYNIGCIEADYNIISSLLSFNPDMIFNIAEGKGGRGREAQMPAIFNLLSIPYTGSDETTLCIALDKALSKKILSFHNINTPKSILSKDSKIEGVDNLNFPVIVKPNAEGSSKGIIGSVVANSKEELNNLIQYKFSKYNMDFIIEEYILGREFTVGVIGNGENKKVFSPMEIIVNPEGNEDGSNVYSYNVKTNYIKYVSYNCPACLPIEIEKEMMDIASKIFDILECKDFSRIDFMLSKTNEIFFIEINPLPGLAPGYSDFPMLAAFNGVEYDELISSVLNVALDRYNSNSNIIRG